MAAWARISWLHINTLHYEGTVAYAECQAAGFLFTQRQTSGNREEIDLTPTLVVTRFWPKGFDACLRTLRPHTT